MSARPPSPGLPSSRRGLIQAVAAVVFNAGFIPGLAPRLKCLSYPVLNCYGCPLAVGACPIGTIQHFAIIRQVPLYIIGFLGVVGSLWGRMTCAWLCPFGWVQDLLHRVPWPRKKLRVDTRRYSWVKYVVAVVLFLVIPYVTLEPWFCKLCPAGTLEAGLPWLAISPPLRALVGGFFWVKLAVFVVFILAAMALSRPFCRFACPLGAMYGLTNRWSRARIRADRAGCSSCGKCATTCPMGLDPRRDANSSDCIRCKECLSCGEQ